MRRGHPHITAVIFDLDDTLLDRDEGFVRFCQELRHGEIERLKIQDGLPVLAEVTKKKIKFGH